MSSRRDFLKNASLIGAGSQLLTACPAVSLTSDSNWHLISQQFLKEPSGMLNFNTGSAGMLPIPVINAYINNTKALSTNAAYSYKEKSKDEVRSYLNRLAQMINCGADEIAFVRNTTDGINLVLNGFPFSNGDEVIVSDLAYPYVLYMMKQLEERKLIRLVKIKVDHLSDEQDLINQYQDAITDKTRLIIVTAVTHQLGKIMPVKAITQLAKQQSIEVLVDAAHCIGQMHQDIEDLSCDYYVSSLHKWLSAPHGTGLLYIKKDRIAAIEPQLSCPKPSAADMGKFEYTGTIAFQNALTMGSVLDFQETIGATRKYNRIKELADMMIAEMDKIPQMELVTDRTEHLGMVSFIADRQAHILQSMEKDFGIHFKLSRYKPKQVVIRLSLNIHLLEADIKYFSKSLQKVLAS